MTRTHNMNEETIVNEHGGAQSKIRYTPRLVPGEAILSLYKEFYKLENHKWRENKVEALINDAVVTIASLLDTSNFEELETAFLTCAQAITIEEQKENYKESIIPPEPLLRIAEVTAAGVEKYGENNWRLIPYVDHLDHAVSHLWLWQTGDTSDDHLGHALCRLAFSIAMFPANGWDFKEVRTGIKK